MLEELARMHLQHFLFYKSVSLNRKTINILHHHTAYDCRKGSKSQGAGIRQVSRFSRECLQTPFSCCQMSQFTINQTKLIIFRSPGISDAGIQRSVAYTAGQRNRYALLQHTNGSCSLCCGNTPYDDGHVVCFSF